MRVELDKKALFALASDTRLEILKAIQPMRRTTTQLSEALSIDKAAVHRHLKKLEEGGLVKRYEDHGFVYYGLSWKTRDLVSPNENTKIVVLLSCSWLLVLGAIFFAAMGLLSPGIDGAANEGLMPDYLEGNDTLLSPEAVDSLLWSIPPVILISGTIVLLIMALRLLRKPKQEVAQDDIAS